MDRNTLHVFEALQAIFVVVCEFNLFPKQQILDSFSMKELTDHSFKFDENGNISSLKE